MGIVVFWVVTACSPVGGYQRFGGTYLSLKMVVIRSSETLVNLLQDCTTSQPRTVQSTLFHSYLLLGYFRIANFLCKRRSDGSTFQCSSAIRCHGSRYTSIYVFINSLISSIWGSYKISGIVALSIFLECRKGTAP
jgi:hypothetical protein